MLPDLSDFLDIPLEHLHDMEGSSSFGDDDSDEVNLPLEPDADSDTTSFADEENDDE